MAMLLRCVRSASRGAVLSPLSRWRCSPAMEEIQHKYGEEPQPPTEEKPHFLAVLDMDEEAEFDENHDRLQFSDDDSGSCSGSRGRRKQVEDKQWYTPIDWRKLRMNIIDDCVATMVDRCKDTDLKRALDKWDGMVGNQLVAAVLNRLNTADDGFAFFKWAGQQYNYTHDALSYGALINLLANVEKDHRRAVIVLKHAERAQVRPDSRMIEILIQGLCSAGQIDEAMDYLEIMLEKLGAATNNACVSILNALFTSGRLDDACSFFDEEMERYGCKPDCITYNCVLGGLCNAGLMSRAAQVFDKMSVPRLGHTYSTMIDGFCKSGDLDAALSYAKQMTEAGHPFHAFTYNTLIQAFSEAGQVEEAYRYYERMITERCITNRKVYFATVSALLKEANDDMNRLEQAREVMEEAISKKHTPYGSVFYDFATRCLEAGRGSWLLELIQKLEARSNYLDTRECCDFVRRLCEGNRTELALSFCGMMHRKGRAVDDETLLAMVRRLCGAGQGGQVLQLLKEMEGGIQAATSTYSAVLRQLCSAGMPDDAMAVYGMMVARSLCVEREDMQQLVRCFCEQGQAAGMGLRVYKAMLRKGMRLDADVAELLLHRLVLAGDAEAAQAVARQMDAS